MKQLLNIFALLVAITAQSQQEPDCTMGEHPAVWGDFDGNGTREMLSLGMADSLGRPTPQIKIEAKTWDEYVYRFGSTGNRSVLMLSNGTGDTLTFKGAQGVYILLNLGNLNNTKGDEIAVVPDLADYSRHSYCHIYSLCNGTWQEVFVFNVHEDSLDDMIVFGKIPGVLEKENGRWLYHDYLEMDYDNPDDVGKMMPLKVDNCK